MSDDSRLRAGLIRLAHKNPQLRGELLPLLKEAALAPEPWWHLTLEKIELLQGHVENLRLYSESADHRALDVMKRIRGLVAEVEDMLKDSRITYRQ